MFWNIVFFFWNVPQLLVLENTMAPGMLTQIILAEKQNVLLSRQGEFHIPLV